MNKKASSVGGSASPASTDHRATTAERSQGTETFNGTSGALETRSTLPAVMVPLQPAAGAVVAAGGGFAILVLEIVGARYLARDFGSSFYVWVSQIGVVMIALALGYYVGGALADRWQRPGLLAWLLWPTGVFVFAIPWLAPPVLEALVNRHPPDEPIAPIWQKLDPALGSAVIFLWPCFVLAMLSPYFIRLTSRHLAHVGRISGLIIAASTVGSIAGVFAAGYLLVDLMALSTIFRWTGVGVFLLGIACWWLDPGATLPEKRSLT